MPTIGRGFGKVSSGGESLSTHLLRRMDPDCFLLCTSDPATGQSVSFDSQMFLKKSVGEVHCASGRLASFSTDSTSVAAGRDASIFHTGGILFGFTVFLQRSCIHSISMGPLEGDEKNASATHHVP